MKAAHAALRLVVARIRHRPARGAIVTLGVAAAIFGVAMTISVRATTSRNAAWAAFTRRRLLRA